MADLSREQLVRARAPSHHAVLRSVSYPSVMWMKQFYRTFPRGSAIPEASSIGKDSTPLSLLAIGESEMVRWIERADAERAPLAAKESVNG